MHEFISSWPSIASLLGSLLLLCPLHAQQDVVMFTHAKPIDDQRYEGIKGSPYFFDNWVVGDVIDNQGELIQGVSLNLNGHTRSVEVRKDDKFIELDASYYRQLEVRPSQNPNSKIEEPYVFMRGLHQRFNNRMVQVMYRGKDISLLLDFFVNLSTKEVNDVGKTVTFETFAVRKEAYLLIGSELHPVRLHKRKFFKDVPTHGDELKAYAKKEGLSLNAIADWQQLVAHYEALR